MNDSHPSTDKPYYAPPTEGSNQGCIWALAGCGVLVLVLAGVIAGLTWWGMAKGKIMLVETFVEVVAQSLNETELPEEQKDKLIARIRNLGDDFISGDLTLEDMEQIGRRMADSRAIIAGGILYFIETEILDKAEIDDETRIAAKRAVQRLARGVVEEKIDVEQLEAIVSEFTEERPDGKKVLKSDFSKENVDKLIESASDLADEAEVPDEAYEVDLATEVDGIIEDVTGIDASDTEPVSEE